MLCVVDRGSGTGSGKGNGLEKRSGGIGNKRCNAGGGIMWSINASGNL